MAGLLRRYDAQGNNAAAAVFVTLNGQFSVQPFQPYQIDAQQTDIKLNASGTVLYQGPLVVLPNGSVRSSPMLFANGQTQSLDALLTPALPASQFLQVIDFNDKGQVLARLRNTASTAQPTSVVLSPVVK